MGLHRVLVQDHEVVGANVLAGRLVESLATVTLVGNHITWHVLSPLWSNRAFPET